MASISSSADGKRTIQFVGKDGKRRSIRLGQVPLKVAQTILVRVETLAAAVEMNVPLDRDSAAWIAGIGDDLAEKLVAVGLIQPRTSSTLGDFLTRYLERRGKDKDRTRINLDAGRRRMVEYFGAGKDLRSITPADADAFLVWLRERYAPGTAARTFRRGRQFLRAAVRTRLLDSNPFDGVKTPSEVDTSKQVFISVEDAKKVIDACPNADLRLIFALARFGGIRIPSEYINLTWDDVLWDRDRIRITSPKTEHHHGKGERFIPIFPELRPYIEEAYHQAEEGAVYLISDRYRDGDVNLRTHMHRVIRRAGLVPWPKLFVNLRSTRETELAGIHPLHKVVTWLGNTTHIAQKHYLQITDEDYQRAAGASVGAVQNPVQQVVQNPVQQGTAPACMTLKSRTQALAECELMSFSSSWFNEQQYTRQDSNL